VWTYPELSTKRVTVVEVQKRCGVELIVRTVTRLTGRTNRSSPDKLMVSDQTTATRTFVTANAKMNGQLQHGTASLTLPFGRCGTLLVSSPLHRDFPKFLSLSKSSHPMCRVVVTCSTLLAAPSHCIRGGPLRLRFCTPTAVNPTVQSSISSHYPHLYTPTSPSFNPPIIMRFTSYLTALALAASSALAAMNTIINKCDFDVWLTTVGKGDPEPALLLGPGVSGTELQFVRSRPRLCM
jgi:hypothetical protein